MPKCEKIFGDEFKPDSKDVQNRKLTKSLRKYFYSLFKSLIVYFDLETLASGLFSIELKNLMISVSNDDQRKEEYTFTSKCAFCQMNDFTYYSPVSIEEKFNNEYACCCMILGIKNNYGN